MGQRLCVDPETPPVENHWPGLLVLLFTVLLSLLSHSSLKMQADASVVLLLTSLSMQILALIFKNSEPPSKMPLHDNYHVDKDPPFPSYRYFALGLLYHYKGQDSAALQVWTSNTPSFCCCQKATNSEMLFLVINLVPLVSLFVILTTDVDSHCGWWPAGLDQIWSLFLHCGLPVLLLQSGHSMEVCWLGASEGSHCRLWLFHELKTCNFVRSILKLFFYFLFFLDQPVWVSVTSGTKCFLTLLLNMLSRWTFQSYCIM